jgi:TFIIF-interacting CTD phosphatase-like protein
MEWMQPESYVADGEDCLLFATRNSQIYRIVFEALSNQRSKHSESE